MICLIRNRILLTIDLCQRFFRSTVYFEFKYIDSLLHLYHNISPANSALYFCIHILPHQPEQEVEDGLIVFLLLIIHIIGDRGEK